MSSTPLFAALARCLPMLGVIAFIALALWAGTLFSVSWLSGRARGGSCWSRPPWWCWYSCTRAC